MSDVDLQSFGFNLKKARVGLLNHLDITKCTDSDSFLPPLTRFLGQSKKKRFVYSSSSRKWNLQLKVGFVDCF